MLRTKGKRGEPEGQNEVDLKIADSGRPPVQAQTCFPGLTERPCRLEKTTTHGVSFLRFRIADRQEF